MSPTQSQKGTSGCRATIDRAASNAPWMSPSAPNSMWNWEMWRCGNVEMWKTQISKFPNLQISLAGLRRHQQIRLVPDEILVAVDRQLVVLAHEDRRHPAPLFALAAADPA